MEIRNRLMMISDVAYDIIIGGDIVPEGYCTSIVIEDTSRDILSTIPKKNDIAIALREAISSGKIISKDGFSISLEGSNELRLIVRRKLESDEIEVRRNISY